MTTLWQRPAVPAVAANLVGIVEGTSLQPYKDGAGVWTIGCGNTKGPDGQPVTADTVALTQDQCQSLLERDLAGSAADLARLVPHVALQDNEAGALISFVYNIGATRVSKSMLLHYVNTQDFSLAVDEFARWNRVGGQPSLGLTRRRWTEAAVFLGADPVEAHRRSWTIKDTAHWPDLDWIYA